MTSAPSIDFLVELTGNRFNPTGVITPLSEHAFELIHDTGLEFMAYGVTDSNGYKLDRSTLDEFVAYAEVTATVAMYHPEYGTAILEAA